MTMPTVAQQVAQDWKFLDFPSIVTLTHQAADGAATTPGIVAETPKQNLRDVTAGAALGITATDQKFVLWSDTMSGAQVFAGDTIADEGGDSWVVIPGTVEETTLGSLSVKWTLMARKTVANA